MPLIRPPKDCLVSIVATAVRFKQRTGIVLIPQLLQFRQRLNAATHPDTQHAGLLRKLLEHTTPYHTTHHTPHTQTTSFVSTAVCDVLRAKMTLVTLQVSKHRGGVARVKKKAGPQAKARRAVATSRVRAMERHQRKRHAMHIPAQAHLLQHMSQEVAGDDKRRSTGGGNDDKSCSE